MPQLPTESPAERMGVCSIHPKKGNTSFTLQQISPFYPFFAWGDSKKIPHWSMHISMILSIYEKSVHNFTTNQNRDIPNASDG